MQQRDIVIIGYEQNTALDLVAAADSFHAANTLEPDPPYRVIIASADGRSFRSEFGLNVVPDCPFDELQSIDTLILPGGSGLRDTAIAKPIVDWIGLNAARISRVASVCTGLFGLAATGLLDGRRATTHWRFAEQLRALHPAVTLDIDAIFVRDGKYYTSAGVTAGIDLALALIEEDLGPRAALAVARELVVYVKRPGGQRQFSDLLRFQTASVPKIRELIHFVDSHLDHELGVEQLAERVHLSVRQFTRIFRESMGMPPAEYVDRARLNEAIRRLTETQTSIDSLAPSIGYRSPDAFARAFRRRFGITPSEYRERFGTAAPKSG